MSIAINTSSARFAGVSLVLVSALVFSTAGVFTKGVSAGPWEIIFWRGIFAAGFTIGYVIWRGTFRREFMQMGTSGWAVAIIGASGSAAFIPAFKLTTMANVMLIYAAAPLLAALFAWLWIGERLTRKVTLGCLAAFAGVGIIVQGSFGGGHLTGNLLALWMTIVMSLIMVIYRRFPETPGAGPAAMSSVVLLPFGLLYGAPFAVPLNEFVVMAPLAWCSQLPRSPWPRARGGSRPGRPRCSAHWKRPWRRCSAGCFLPRCRWRRHSSAAP